MKVYAIIPARSGSKGLPNKNIKEMAGVPLIGYSIAFARQLNVDKIICSTDSVQYADIAMQYGAEVPFLRSDIAAVDSAMEEDIINDLEMNFDRHDIAIPDIYIWLRPTFIFRSIDSVNACVKMLVDNPNLSACRTVVPSESRLYTAEREILKPIFDDKGRSMCRRQDTPLCYKVYSTDVFRGKRGENTADFLGRSIGFIETSKVCGMDIDDEFDWMLVEALLSKQRVAVMQYLHI